MKMFDDFIILSTDRIIDIWNLKSGAWLNDEDNSYILLYSESPPVFLTEAEGKEFLQIFKGRYEVNAVPQIEKENK